MDKGLALALLFACVLALSGCVLKDQQDNSINDTDKITQQEITVPKYISESELICNELAGSQPCYCITCTSKPYLGFIGRLLGLWYDGDLTGQRCGAVSCNATDYQDYLENKSVQMRSFALSSGQSFVSTGNANLYCNDSLQIATKWMKGTAESPPRIPETDRATCWLERSILPLYIYYTEGKNIDPERTRGIAQKFQDIGPAMITTEAGWNSLDTAGAALVKQQLDAINSCDKCTTVLAVQPGDYAALESIMGKPENKNTDTYYGMVDVVGFGFRVNDYPYCNMDRVVSENIEFSRYILQNYSKPSIWLYVGASEGGPCNWKAKDIQDFYSKLLERTGGFASSGIIGMSNYEFIDESGAIPCNESQGCKFGLFTASGDQKRPVLNIWSEMCLAANTGGEHRKPIIFSKNGQAGVCDINELRNDYAFLKAAERIQTGQGLLEDEVTPKDRAPDVGCGEVCPANVSMPDAYGNMAVGAISNSFCKNYSIIDERADDEDISATYMRAIVMAESGFNASAISCVNETNQGCNIMNYTAKQICALAGDPQGCDSSKTCKTGEKVCAFGLAQCIEYPGKYYAEKGIALADQSMKYIAACGGYGYNPFSPGMSACCGAKKFRDYLNTAETWTNNNWAALNTCNSGAAEGEKGWMSYYLASFSYNGNKIDHLADFTLQLGTSTDTCIGDINYATFLANNVTNYSKRVMSFYEKAITTCDNSDCLN